MKYSHSTKEDFQRNLENMLDNRGNTDLQHASSKELYKAVARIINQQLLEKRWAFHKKIRKAQTDSDDTKKIYYISMEFLMGQSLKNNLYNLEMTHIVEEVLKESSYSLEDLYREEPDAGLGNGGLGRLAACYLDALASGGYDATGFSIRYEYGLFHQKLVDGWQVEMPDNWLPGGHVWLNPHEDETVKVRFFGNYHEYWEEDGMHFQVTDEEVIDAVPYDMYVSGANSEAVAKLRLWKSEAPESFDMVSFNNGDFTKAAQRNNRAELISKVLYPADNVEDGKELRLKQQYFMVSASCQTIVKEHLRVHHTLDNFHQKNVIHINDTHPALCVPELMRILMDEYGCSWEYAWHRVKNTVSYTNHTILAEALEKWSDQTVKNLMPRIFIIIEEINRRFRKDMEQLFPGDEGKINYMAPLGDWQVRMANLAMVGANSVNGVSGLHSDILREKVFHDFALANPAMFHNVTNGIAYRRWLCQSNPELTALIDECIGDEYLTKPEKLAEFAAFKEDKGVLEQLRAIKRNNKVRFSEKLQRETGVVVNPDSIFIVQAKRLHEYKRQLLNALRIISRYNQLKQNPQMEMIPETYLFAAKTAPNYYAAKKVIQMIWALGQEIQKDPVIAEKLQVVFLENYSVSMAEALMPATEISQQISLAGKEASGTGNMKMMINGALTIGTMDGANVEMFQSVGAENIYIFGQSTEEVAETLAGGYDSSRYVEGNRQLKDVLAAIMKGFNGESFQDIYEYLLNPTYSIADPYMCLKDFEDYCRVQEIMLEDYKDAAKWNSKSVVNIAMAGGFAADRAIGEYAKDIWKTSPVVRNEK